VYKFNNYSGLTPAAEVQLSDLSVIKRDFSEEVEILERDLKIPFFLFSDNTVTYYLDVMISVGGQYFYTCERFLTKVIDPLDT